MSKKFKSVIRNYFGFSATETNGFIILLFIMLLALFLPSIYSYFLKTSDKLLVSETEELDSLVSQIEKKIASGNILEKKVEDFSKVALFKFDPNVVNLSQLKTLGVSTELAHRIIKYRNSGGKFYIKRDLKKIYGIGENLYNTLQPFIDLPEKNNYFDKAPDRSSAESIIKREKPEVSVNFDINLADSSQLMMIKGIGKVLSSRIIKFRDKLGGFVSMQQCKEVYGLADSIAQRLIKVSFVSDMFHPRYININEVEEGELRDHPYISLKLARAILLYRKQHGKFKSPNDLLNIHLMSTGTFNKIKPYLKL